MTDETPLPSTKAPKIVGGIFSGIGLVLVLVACVAGYRAYQFLGKAVVVPGIVNEAKQAEVVLQYHYSGKNYSINKAFDPLKESFKVGDQIQLLVDPELPGKPNEDSLFTRWFLTLLLGSLGLIFAGVGIIVNRAFSKP